MPSTEVFYLKGFEIMGNLSASYDVDMALKYGIEVAALYNKLEYLARYTTREDGYCWRTAEELENEIGLSKKQQALAVKKLENAGLIYTKVTYIQGTQKRSKHFFVVGTSNPESNQTSLSEIPESNQTANTESYQTSLSESAKSDFLYNNNHTVINKHNNIKKERKKENSFDEILKDVENSDLKDLYIEYIKMRKLIKKPMTDRALRMLMKKVNDLEPNSVDRQKKLLENAIVSNWLSVYPLKDNGTYSAGYSKPGYSQPVQPKREETEEEIQKRQHEQYLRACEVFGWDPDADIEEVEEKSPEERLREIYEEQERVREGRKREWT